MYKFIIFEFDNLKNRTKKIIKKKKTKHMIKFELKKLHLK